MLQLNAPKLPMKIMGPFYCSLFGYLYMKRQIYLEGTENYIGVESEEMEAKGNKRKNGV
jgi:hypothetical protein